MELEQQNQGLKTLLSNIIINPGLNDNEKVEKTYELVNNMIQKNDNMDQENRDLKKELSKMTKMYQDTNELLQQTSSINKELSNENERITDEINNELKIKKNLINLFDGITNIVENFKNTREYRSPPKRRLEVVEDNETTRTIQVISRKKPKKAVIERDYIDLTNGKKLWRIIEGDYQPQGKRDDNVAEKVNLFVGKWHPAVFTLTNNEEWKCIIKEKSFHDWIDPYLFNGEDNEGILNTQMEVIQKNREIWDEMTREGRKPIEQELKVSGLKALDKKILEKTDFPWATFWFAQNGQVINKHGRATTNEYQKPIYYGWAKAGDSGNLTYVNIEENTYDDDQH